MITVRELIELLGEKEFTNRVLVINEDTGERRDIFKVESGILLSDHGKELEPGESVTEIYINTLRQVT